MVIGLWRQFLIRRIKADLNAEDEPSLLLKEAGEFVPRRTTAIIECVRKSSPGVALCNPPADCISQLGFEATYWQPLQKRFPGDPVSIMDGGLVKERLGSVSLEKLESARVLSKELTAVFLFAGNRLGHKEFDKGLNKEGLLSDIAILGDDNEQRLLRKVIRVKVGACPIDQLPGNERALSPRTIQSPWCLPCAHSIPDAPANYTTVSRSKEAAFCDSVRSA
ncbi:MAG: hypothetical protein JNL98_04615 [Bryobacterales bacterium]|nr:hypothetical protein [Bryobacterales bacterium]